MTGFADFVLECLQRHGVPADRICFEITETAAVAQLVAGHCPDESPARPSVAGSRSTISVPAWPRSRYLKNLPVDYIKIDGSFIRDLGKDPLSSLIVRAVTDIGHQLGLLVVAEWVADEEARDILRALGVDYAQGYLVHRPAPVPRFARLS